MLTQYYLNINFTYPLCKKMFKFNQDIDCKRSSIFFSWRDEQKPACTHTHTQTPHVQMHAHACTHQDAFLCTTGVSHRLQIIPVLYK